MSRVQPPERTLARKAESETVQITVEVPEVHVQATEFTASCGGTVARIIGAGDSWRIFNIPPSGYAPKALTETVYEDLAEAHEALQTWVRDTERTRLFAMEARRRWRAE